MLFMKSQMVGLLSGRMRSYYDIISAKEKQATLKAAFVFLALLTSKQTAKQAGKRRMRSLRVYVI